MELKLEILSAKNWVSGFKGIIPSEQQYKCEKGKKPLRDSEVSSSKKGSKNLAMNFSGGKACGDSSKGKTVLWGSEVEELNHRLKILEEETEIMKDAFFWSMEERKNMMNEIYQQFQVLHRSLQSRDLDGRLIGSLPEILGPDPNPSLLTRDLRANVLAFQESAQFRGYIKFHHD